MRKPILQSIVLVVCVWATFLGISRSAFAFSISDHQWMTQKAVREVNDCILRLSQAAKPLTVESEGRLSSANISEDLNLIQKWAYYSHYFRPHETLDLIWRGDSSVRVRDLLAQGEFNLEIVGGVLHYLQDSACPLHVIPVSHGYFDRFENYAVSDSLLQESKGEISCETLFNPSNSPLEGIAQDLLNESAEKTLALFQSENLRLKESDQSLTLDHLWKLGNLQAGTRYFGDYGNVGNSFGLEVLTDGQNEFPILPGEYDRLKLVFLRHGIEMSKKWLAAVILRGLKQESEVIETPLEDPIAPDSIR